MKKLSLMIATSMLLVGCGDPHVFDASEEQISCNDFYGGAKDSASDIEDSLWSGNSNKTEKAVLNIYKISADTSKQTKKYMQTQIEEGELPATFYDFYKAGVDVPKDLWEQVEGFCNDGNMDASIAGITTHLVLPHFEDNIEKTRYISWETFEDEPEESVDRLLSILTRQPKAEALEWYTIERIIEDTLEYEKLTKNTLVFDSFERVSKRVNEEYSNHLGKIAYEKRQAERAKRKAEAKALKEKNAAKREELRPAINAYNSEINALYTDMISYKDKSISYTRKAIKRTNPGNSFYYKHIDPVGKELENAYIRVLDGSNFDYLSYNIDYNRLEKAKVMVNEAKEKYKHLITLTDAAEIREFVNSQ